MHLLTSKSVCGTIVPGGRAAVIVVTIQVFRCRRNLMLTAATGMPCGFGAAAISIVMAGARFKEVGPAQPCL